MFTEKTANFLIVHAIMSGEYSGNPRGFFYQVEVASKIVVRAAQNTWEKSNAFLEIWFDEQLLYKSESLFVIEKFLCSAPISEKKRNPGYLLRHHDVLLELHPTLNKANFRQIFYISKHFPHFDLVDSKPLGKIVQ